MTVIFKTTHNHSHTLLWWKLRENEPWNTINVYCINTSCWSHLSSTSPKGNYSQKTRSINPQKCHPCRHGKEYSHKPLHKSHLFAFSFDLMPSIRAVLRTLIRMLCYLCSPGLILSEFPTPVKLCPCNSILMASKRYLGTDIWTIFH